jgi:hypothetical protein
MPDKRTTVKALIVAILLVISAFMGVYGNALSNDGKTERTDALFTNGGKIIAPTGSPSDQFSIIFATNIIYVDRETLTDGIDLGHYIGYGNISYPVQVSLENGNLVISAKITDMNGNVIAEIVNNNQWRRINPDLSFDRNYNSYAFEIISDVSKTQIPNVIPVLQVVLQNQSSILIGCYAQDNDMQVVASLNEGMINFPPNEVINKSYAPILFQYPSKDYPGAYLNPNFVRNFTIYNPDSNTRINGTEVIIFPTGSAVSQADQKILVGLILEICGVALGAIVGVFATIWIYRGKKS